MKNKLKWDDKKGIREKNDAIENLKSLGLGIISIKFIKN